MSKRMKSSRVANQHTRARQIVNGLGQAGPKSPVFVVKGKRIVRLTRQQYDKLVDEAEGLSYFAGEYILPEDLV